MQSARRSDAEVQEAVRSLFEGVAPERNSELEKLWKDYKPRFNILADDRPNEPVMQVRLYHDDEIEFNHRAMRAFWLAAFIAWEASIEMQVMHTSDPIDCSRVSEIIEILQRPHEEQGPLDFKEMLKILARLHKEQGALAVEEMLTRESTDLGRFDEMLEVFFKILDPEQDPRDIEMPNGVPEPGPYPDLQESDIQSPIDSAKLAVGWGFLHEIKHLQNLQNGTNAKRDDSKKKWHKEELACDEFATTFLLEKVEEYAQMKSEDAQSVKRKRNIGIYAALFAMTLMKAKNWKASRTHPKMQTRIDATTKCIDDFGNSILDQKTGYMMFTRLQLLWPDAPCPYRTQ